MKDGKKLLKKLRNKSSYAIAQQKRKQTEMKVVIVGRHAFQETILGHEQPLFLRREPNNPHDSNAIGAYTLAGEQIGHVNRKVASVLAKCMDVDEKWYGIVYSGHEGKWKCTALLD